MLISSAVSYLLVMARNVRQSIYYSFIPRRFLNWLYINMVPWFYYNLYYKEIRS